MTYRFQAENAFIGHSSRVDRHAKVLSIAIRHCKLDFNLDYLALSLLRSLIEWRGVLRGQRLCRMSVLDFDLSLIILFWLSIAHSQRVWVRCVTRRRWLHMISLNCSLHLISLTFCTIIIIRASGARFYHLFL